MTKKSDEQQMQQAALEFQIIESQIRQLEEQFNQIETKKTEIEGLEMNLGELKKTKNRESYSDIGLGIYAKTKILDDTNLLVNVGGGIHTFKKVQEIREILKKQSKELDRLSKEIVQNIQSLSMRAQQIQLNLEKLSN